MKTSRYGFARATEIMNTKSMHDYQWSIKLGNSHWFYIGVASRLQKAMVCIEDYDKNAILFNTTDGIIYLGKNEIQKDVIKPQDGDLINCRFQPKLKKFCVSLVRFHLVKITASPRFETIILYVLSQSFCARIRNLNLRKIKNMLSISRMK